MVRATTRKGRTAGKPRAPPKPKSPKIPRPPNRWILFRTDFNKKRENAAAVGGCQRQLSGSASFVWHRLPPQEVAIWEKKAAEAKALHALMYPDYKFAPQRKGEASKEEDDEDEEMENVENLRDDDDYTPAKEVRRSQRTKAVKAPRYVATPEPSVEEERTLSPEPLPVAEIASVISTTDIAETFSESDSEPDTFHDYPYQWQHFPVGMLDGPPTETYLYGPNGRPRTIPVIVPASPPVSALEVEEPYAPLLVSEWCIHPDLRSTGNAVSL